jgi:hypothetical protein
MSDMYMSPITDEHKMLAYAAKRSETDRFSNPDGDGVTVHYHSADEQCEDRAHRFYIDGKEVVIGG